MKHLILTLALLCGMIIPSVGHEWWGNGTEVDPETKRNCCGKDDCRFIDEKTLIRKVTPQGIYLEFPNPVPPIKELEFMYKKKVKETIPYRRVKPSPDGKYWACISPRGDIICYWEPNSGV